MYKLNVIEMFNNYKQFSNVLKKTLFQTIPSQCQRMSSFKHNENLSSNLNEPTNEKEFLVRIKNNPDLFGDNTTVERIENIYSKEDQEEEKFLTEIPAASEKQSTKQYADLIKEYIKQRKIKEAIDVLEIKMLVQDRVRPENYIYNLLLGACGRVGYTKKAFSLYNQMKKRDLAVTGGTYTALFNACANSPWHHDGLDRAKHLRHIMIEKQYEPNPTNYNAMIKAFGRCGDLSTAFNIVDEMDRKKIKLKDETINFLLHACISDKEAGFRHALLVWRKLLNKNIKPSIYTYNLMLRCIRDCGLGDAQVTEDVIQRLVANDSNKNTALLDNVKLISGDNSNLNTMTQDSFTRPNLMAKVAHLGGVISLSEVTKPEDRLLLVGGCSGFLDNMQSFNCAPDIKTMTQLLDTIPSTLAAEKDLLLAIRKFKIRMDVDFLNMLIKKRSLRFDYENAKEVIKIMTKKGLKPDLITYGVLALGCKTKEEGLELVEALLNANYRLNSEILGAMMNQACYHYNFGYVFELMEMCTRYNIEVNKRFLNHLDEFKRNCRIKINAKTETPHFEKTFMIFRQRYKTWLTQVVLDSNEDKHPWQQFKENTNGDTKYKLKDVSRFKPKHNSLFRVRTSTKQRDRR